MHKFKKGQLVAVRDFTSDRWHIAVYVRKRNRYYMVVQFFESSSESSWSQCVPAQEAFPWMDKFNIHVCDAEA